jgi:hypothetical protein
VGCWGLTRLRPSSRSGVCVLFLSTKWQVDEMTWHQNYLRHEKSPMIEKKPLRLFSVMLRPFELMKE